MIPQWRTGLKQILVLTIFLFITVIIIALVFL